MTREFRHSPSRRGSSGIAETAGRALGLALVLATTLMLCGCQTHGSRMDVAEAAEGKVTLRGQVVDSAGNGIPGIAIVVEQERRVREQLSPLDRPRYVWSVASDGEGNWDVDGPVPNITLLISAGAGRAWLARPRGPHAQDPEPNEIGVLTPTEAVISGIDFVLYHRASIVGQVLGPGGRPLEGALIHVLDSGSSTRSGTTGHFRVDWFVPGTPVTLIVKHEDAATRICDPVSVEEGQTLQMEARLSAGGAVRGRLTPREGKVAYNEVLQPSLRFLPAGRLEDELSLRVRRVWEPGSPGGPCAMGTDIVPRPDKTGLFLVEHLPAGKVDLHLTAWWDFTPEGEQPDHVTSRFCRETPPELLARMAPALRTLFPVVKYPVLFFGTVSDIEVREGEVTDLGDIHYEQPGRLTGRVLDAGDKPVHDMPVYLTLTKFERVGMHDANSKLIFLDTVMTRTDAEGRYTFEHLCRGRRKVWIGRFDGPHTEKVEIDMGGREQVEIDLRLADR